MKRILLPLALAAAITVPVGAQFGWFSLNGGLIARMSSATTAVTIRQDGTGDILALYDGATKVWSVADGGNQVVGNAQALGWADLPLYRDSANTLAQRNGTNNQLFRVYGTYTDASNYERLIAGSVANAWYLLAEQAGTGVARSVNIGTAGAQDVAILTSNTPRWTVGATGHLTANADNTYDIGASGAKPRMVYTGVVAVASLPACAAGTQGARMMVTDANATTFLSTVAGGGANVVPVVCNGTNWVIG